MKKSKKHQIDPPETRIDRRAAFPVIEGMERAAAILGAPLAILKQLKRGNSRAFLRGGRVDTGILIPEIFAALDKGSELPEGIATPQDWLATEKARRESIKRQQDERSVMPTDEVVRHAAEASGLFASELERWAREFPPAFAGLPASGVAARMESEVENTRRRLKIKLAEISK
jgi:hypothetical protein